MESLNFKRHNSLKIKIIEKPHTVFLPDIWFLSCKKNFENSIKSAWVGAPQKTDRETQQIEVLSTSLFLNSNFFGVFFSFTY